MTFAEARLECAMEQETGHKPTISRAILGGSFDPVHRGHLGMASAVIKAIGVEEVVFVPCFVSPFKDGTLATGEQRFELLKRAVDDEGLSWASVSRFEIEREGPSYSWQTAAHFVEGEPDTKWHWIVGTDQWDSIEKWANPGFLRENLHFIVMTRDGREVESKKGWSAISLTYAHQASSTSIRKDFVAHEEWLTPGVISFCRESGLYGA